MNVKIILGFFLIFSLSFSYWQEFNYDTINSGTFGGYNPLLEVKHNSTYWITQIGSSDFELSSSPAFSMNDLSGTSTLPPTIYIASSNSNTLYALNASDGSQLWNFTAPFISGQGGFISSPAVYTDNSTNTTYVVIGNKNTFLYALNASDGSQIWNTTLLGPIYPSPAIYGNTIYIGAGSLTHPDYYALNISDGSVLWSYSSPGNQVRSSPTIYEGKVYFTMSRPSGSSNSLLYALNTTTGSQIWNYSFPNPNTTVKSSPAISPSSGILYIATSDGYIYALNTTTGSQIWNYSLINSSSAIVSSPSVIDCGLPSPICDIVFIGADGLYALNATTGSLIWHYNDSSYVVASTPAFDSDVVYFASGNLAIFGGDDTGKVYALNATTGSLLWSSKTPSKISSSPAIVNLSPSMKVLYIQDVDGRVYAFGKDEPPSINVLTPNTPSYTNSYFNILWNASDPNGDTLLISCYGDNDSTGYDALEECFINTSNDGNENCDTTLWSEGTYYIWCSAFDGELTSYNYSNSTLSVDRTPPSYYNITTSPTTPSLYSETQNYQFNITWIDSVVSVDFVWIEHNFTGTFVNYTVISHNGSIYYYNYSTLSAGNYSYKWYANDTLGNLNSTPYYNYSVLKAFAPLTLNAQPSWNVTYPEETNISCSAPQNLPLNLYRNGTLVASGNGYIEEVANLSAGTYVYVCNTTGNENYSSNSTSNTLTINKSPAPLSLSSSPSWNVNYPTETNVSCSAPQNLPLNLYRNGTLVASGNGYIEEVASLSLGEYAYTCNTSGNENYTNATSSQVLHVLEQESSPTTPTLHIYYETTCPDNLLQVFVSSSDEPLNDVKVILFIKQGSSYSSLSTKYTNSEGKVEFVLEEEGYYKLKAYSSGYKEDEEIFEYSLCEIHNQTNESNETLFCPDFTEYGECSKTKPLYCENGTLIENCALCGCNKGYDCINNTCVKETKKGEIKNQTKKEKKEKNNKHDKEIIPTKNNNEKVIPLKDKKDSITLKKEDEEELASKRKSSSISYFYSMVEGAVFSKDCCFFNVCSFFGFIKFLGVCWFVWLVAILLIIASYFIYIKLNNKSQRNKKESKFKKFKR